MSCWRLRYAGIGNWPDAYFANEYISIDYPIEENLHALRTRCPKNAFRRAVEQSLPAGWDRLSLHHASENICNFFAGILSGDFLLCKDSCNFYHVGILGDYEYAAHTTSPHRRKVIWRNELIPVSSMTYDLRRACASGAILKDISRFQMEIESLMGRADMRPPSLNTADNLYLDLLLEQYLEKNWRRSAFFPRYELLVSGSSLCPASLRGMVDLLAISGDKSEFLALEIKKCRPAGDLVNSLDYRLRQAAQDLEERGQRISGAILTTEKNSRLEGLAELSPNIRIYVFDLDFRFSPLSPI